MNQNRGLIAVVDDDISLRESLPDLLGELGHPAKAFSSASEFLNSDTVSRTWCLVLDVNMPDMTGPELQAELIRRGIMIPIIFITALFDEKQRTDLIARGGIECLPKPFSESALRAALTRVR